MDNSISNSDIQLAAPVSGMGLLQFETAQNQNRLDLNKEIVISVANSSKAGKGQWSEATLSRKEFIDELIQHKDGAKDGPCFLQGELLERERKKHLVKENHIIGFDVDTGEPSQALIERLSAFDYAFAIYSTHSHGKASTEVTAKALANFVGRPIENLRCTNDEANDFLRDDRNYHESALVEVKINDEEIDGKFTIEHAPLSKHRIVLFLDQPFEFQVDDDAKERAIAWGEYYRGVGLKFGIDFDESCTDSSRLFYFPRCPNDGPKPFSRFVDGKALRLEDFERIPKWAAKTMQETGKSVPNSNRNSVEHSSPKDSEHYMFDGFNLKRWSMNYNFKPVVALVAKEHPVRDDIAMNRTGFAGDLQPD